VPHLIVVGLSHKTAPVEQREKASLGEAAVRSLLRDLAAGGAVDEAAALSTCNRTEVFAVAEEIGRAEEALCAALVDHSHIRRAELDCARYSHLEDRAAGHLFRVSSSLDSMVLGESEIQAQVRSAWQLAREEGVVGPVLNHLFRQAVETGKRVRHETRISEGAISVSSVAVELVREALPDLAGRRALVIGAGKMAEATARAFMAAGLRDLVVANRTVGTAVALAERCGGRGIGFDQVGLELVAADIVVSSTDAPHVILARDDIARVMAARPERRMVLIDIAVPRDMDATIARVPNVELHDIDDLERVVEANLNGRAMEAERAERMVAGEIRRFAEWRQGLAVAPTISSLRERVEAIRRTELAKADAHWESLSQADRERLDALTSAIVNKILHEPTIRVRAAAETGEGLAHVESLRHLFDLPVPEQQRG
jgi:glutamyl-tRNA reductase